MSTVVAAFICTVACAAALGGCRKKDTKGSGARSVDAIVTGDETQRQNLRCGRDGPASETPEGAVDQVFAQVPRRFTTEFPTLRSHIALADAAAVESTCRGVFERQAARLFGDGADVDRALKRLDNLGACWSLSLGGDLAPVPVPTIHLTRDVTAIHNNLLAMVAYGIMELYADRVGDGVLAMNDEARTRLLGQVDGGEPPVSADDVRTFIMDLRDLRRGLAEAVVADLTALGRTDTLARYRERFGARSDAQIADTRLAQNLFFAESVESYYCSPESRRLFPQRGLERTWEQVKRVAAYLDR